MKLYIWQPGNGTRYFMFAHQVNSIREAQALGISAGGWLIGEATGLFKSHAFQPQGFIDPCDVAKRMGVSGGDNQAVAQFISWVTRRATREEPWPRCEKCSMPIDPANPYNRKTKICVTCEYGGW